ncbi:flagellar assembly protein FliX [Bradyrhizobium sp. SYSU BS000235]|uniref:flagellar assembly protein FliX n=1 Tax=Bradyrhizobium sp. SYSU BS000235 TaxID=3411332 RepID=UPI003C72E3E5
MRIYGPSGTSQTPPKASARRSSSSGFSIEDTSVPVETRPATAPRTAGGIEALLAMQGFDDPTERRRRSVQRGRSALDVLDDLKIGLLTGALDSSMVGRLRTAAAELKSVSGDPRLDQVLSEIELRVEVELAKAGQVKPVNTGF